MIASMSAKWARLLVRTIVGGIALGVVLNAVPATAADENAALPLRKAGRWELKTVMDEGRGPREQVLTMCIDADMERNTAAASKASHEQNCTEYKITKAGETTSVKSQCVFDGRNVESVTDMTGDFETTFKITIESTTSGSERGQSVSVKRSITQDGKYLGESCGDLRAGEAMGTDGDKIMVQ
jgi:Protein of unknown function (DUF3617)